MLAYVSLAIGLSVITVIFVFVVTWGYLYDEIRHTAQLREEFHSTIRRLIVSVCVAVIPVVIYLIETRGQPAHNAELYAFVWVVCLSKDTMSVKLFQRHYTSSRIYRSDTRCETREEDGSLQISAVNEVSQPARDWALRS